MFIHPFRNIFQGLYSVCILGNYFSDCKHLDRRAWFLSYLTWVGIEYGKVFQWTRNYGKISCFPGLLPHQFGWMVYLETSPEPFFRQGCAVERRVRHYWRNCVCLIFCLLFLRLLEKEIFYLVSETYWVKWDSSRKKLLTVLFYSNFFQFFFFLAKPLKQTVDKKLGISVLGSAAGCITLLGSVLLHSHVLNITKVASVLYTSLTSHCDLYKENGNRSPVVFSLYMGRQGWWLLFTFVNGLNFIILWPKIIRTVYSVLGARLRIRYTLWKKSAQLRCIGKGIFSWL